MGNDHSTVRKIFTKLDPDSSGVLTLDQILQQRELPDVEHWSSTHSPILLFRFDESQQGSINYEEFNRLLKHLQMKEKQVRKNLRSKKGFTRSNSFVWTAVNHQSAEKLDLSRDTPPPMITGRKPVMNDEASEEELEEAELVALLQKDAKEFFSKLLQTEEGRKQFLAWLFHLADVDQSNSISLDELSLVLSALSTDGIMPEYLSFDGAVPSDPNAIRKLSQNIMNEYDTQHHGYLSFDEFMQLGDLILKYYEATPPKDDQNLVGKYILKRKLGKGSSGVVMLGVDKETKVRKAIKIVPRGDVSNMSRLDVEIKAMLMLRHPNIVLLEEVLETEDNVYFIMELCGGGNLSKHVELQPLEEGVALFYFLQLIDAVEYCHNQGVCHRDLKLENLLLVNDGNLKVTDFGHAGIFSIGWDIFSTGLMGTLWHLSPEQISGQCYSGEKIDIWAMGVLLYRLVVGKPPFFSTDPTEFVASIQHLTYDVPEHISPEFKNLLEKILKIEPAERISLEAMKEEPWCKGTLIRPTFAQQQIPLPDSITPGECWDALEEVTEEKIHIHDAEIDPTGPIKRMAKCRYPAKDIKFSVTFKQTQPGMASLEFELREGEAWELYKIIHATKHYLLEDKDKAEHQSEQKIEQKAEQREQNEQDQPKQKESEQQEQRAEK